MKIQTRLSLLLIAVSVGVVTTAGIFTTLSLDAYFSSRIAAELSTQVREADVLLRSFAPAESSAVRMLDQYCAAGGFRLTLITRSGTVVFDSGLPREQLPEMENHLGRSEVREALRSGTGTEKRYSATLGNDLFYFAARIDTPLPAAGGFRDAAVLRVAIPLTHIEAAQREIASTVVITSVLLLLVVAGLAVVLSKRLAQPIKEMAETAHRIQGGNLDQRIKIRSNDELGLLAASLNSMVDTLNADITKLKKLEQVRSEFLGNVSHELRTPIFAIQGMLETLINGALDDREVNRSFVESALRNTERLNTLLSDLIDISSIESGEMKMSFRYFPIGAFLESVVAELSLPASRKEISLRLSQVPPELDVLGDKDRLRQVMVNLIDNAIKYSESGRSVVVSAEQVGPAVAVRVADSGFGIPAADIPRIFERFYRVDKERSRDAGGTGLGLAIVKHIVEAHGSRIVVDSTAGEGSTFSFTLPSL